MRDVAESDWKLFKKMLPQWQERYMEKLIGQYVEMLILFPFLLGYVYIVLSVSQNNSYIYIC